MAQASWGVFRVNILSGFAFPAFRIVSFLNGSQVEHVYYVMAECMHAWD